MNIIVKYAVQKSFTDKYTKEEIAVNTILDISVERMKELNEKNVGRVVDIVLSEEIEEEKSEELSEDDEKLTDKKYTKEELDNLSVNELKELAENEGYQLTKAKKSEIIEEILNQ